MIIWPAFPNPFGRSVILFIWHVFFCEGRKGLPRLEVLKMVGPLFFFCGAGGGLKPSVANEDRYDR